MRVALIVAVVLTGCVTAQTMPEANTEFVAKGEIRWRGKGASFDDVRIRSPRMNLTRRTDGSWGGTFDNAAMDVDVTPDTIRGVGFVLSRAESQKDKLVITGHAQVQFNDRIYRFELDANQALVRGPELSLTLPGRDVSEGKTTYGPAQELTLLGQAAGEAPPWPQIGFALVATFAFGQGH